MTSGTPGPDEPHWLILACFRSHREAFHQTTNSRVIRANCGHLAWLSPNSEPFVDVAYTCCEDCAAEVMQTSSGARCSVPGALAEIERTFGRQARGDCEEFMRRQGITPADPDNP